MKKVILAFLVLGAASCKRDAAREISVSGNIELTEVNIAFKVPGKLVELAVEEGSAVQKGLVLGRLDTEQLRRQRERDQAGFLAAESQLVQLSTSIQQLKASVAAEIDLRKAEHSQAEARLRDLRAGSRSQEIEQAQAAVEEARAQEVQARRDWERAQVLYKNEDISTSQFDEFKARFDRSQAALRQTEERLSLVREGARKEEIEAARAQVDRAAAGLRLAEAARFEITRKEQEETTLKAEIERARAQVAILDSQLRDVVAASPIDGVVLVKSAEVGEILAAGTAFLTVGDLDRPWLRGYVHEQDLGRVKLGAKAKVTTDSYPGKVYWGRISFISSEAEFTPKQIQTSEERVKLVYRIKIDIANPQQELKLNMPADATILLDER
jgi:HlyD family secretion protein